MIKLRSFWKFIAIFIIGISIGLIIRPTSSYQVPFSDKSLDSSERLSPGDWVKEENIKVTEKEVKIDIKNASWAKFADTNSMDPFLDEKSNAIQKKPKKEELIEGDIISYRPKGKKNLIIHRIIEIGNDGEWYAIVKGDNNKLPDKEKVRFNQIEKVLIAIIY